MAIKLKRGRKPKKPSEKVVSKNVYLKQTDWDIIEKKYGTPTNAVKELIK